ncbi:hypothetical protein [Paracoccus xiamenensis]|uniref:hypothetical protein n=1 Tax=Paracoccus xiamenensis TaxID=2714901 RepID=UPI00140A1F29|nr:hypothetical protein [Paracoccus xiamenensis]NHF73893.1 hypothetical protein [Paracoccus xiamenensis]
MIWVTGGWPDKPLVRCDQILVLVIALLGAVAGWFVIDRLGRPGWRGLLRDIGIAALALVLTVSVGMAGFFAPAAIIAPLWVLLSLAHPLTGPIALIGAVVLLGYARLTIARPVTPATIPPA